MKNKPKIFTIGGATFDMFIQPHDHGIMRYRTPKKHEDWLCLDYGAKVKIDHVEESYGGGGTNTAIAFARMGFEACFIGKVGDEYGDKVIKNLEDNQVDAHCVKKTTRDKTAFSTILSAFEGDRTVLAYPGANRFFSAEDLPVDELAKADWIFLNHLTKKHSRIPQKLLKILKQNPRIKFAWNPGREQLEEGVKKWKSLLEHTTILFVNKEEAALFTQKSPQIAGMKKKDTKCHFHLPKSFLPPYADDVSEIMYEFFRHGPKYAVVTDGRNGAQVSDGKRLYFCPVPGTKRQDTTGAGDAFASGFTSAIMLGENLKTALKFGTINAAGVISSSGAQTGLMTQKEIEKELKKVDICVTSTKLT